MSTEWQQKVQAMRSGSNLQNMLDKDSKNNEMQSREAERKEEERILKTRNRKATFIKEPSFINSLGDNKTTATRSATFTSSASPMKSNDKPTSTDVKQTTKTQNVVSSFTTPTRSVTPSTITSQPSPSSQPPTAVETKTTPTVVSPSPPSKPETKTSFHKPTTTVTPVKNHVESTPPQRSDDTAKENAQALQRETQQRQQLEKSINEKDREIAELKRQLAEQKKEKKVSIEVPAPSSSSSVKPPSADGGQKTVEQQKRITKRLTKRLTASLGDVVDTLSTQVDDLEQQCTKTEERLLDVAISKIQADSVIQQVDNLIKKIIDSYNDLSSEDIKRMLFQMTMMLNENGGNKNRFSLFVPANTNVAISGAFAPPPPPAAPMSRKPSTATLPTQNRAPSHSVSAGSFSSGSLLDQIRNGTTLRNVDVNKLRQEQEELKKRTSVSIGSILKNAMASRLADMSLEDEDDDEECPDLCLNQSAVADHAAELGFEVQISEKTGWPRPRPDRPIQHEDTHHAPRDDNH
ncbi:hypothetical protein PROFUN_07391 [Planoprotostelium fungivorum]|uniref:Uncharacterized protein n=1 Tax=Planoprotostelium fungivorum TaxID=1890364 RepID=A0A2P6MTG3_9EUKA|nr:hypothetical protein PROFUN_07391 [Planoprotostelium fungivorum]